MNKVIKEEIQKILQKKESCEEDCECILCFLEKCFCECGEFTAKECEYCRKKMCNGCICPQATYMCLECDLNDVSDGYYRY